MTDQNIQPCPFPLCGGSAKLVEFRYANTGHIYGYAIRCQNCGLELSRKPEGWPIGHEQKAMETAKLDVLKLWNTR